jgi:hypothetical protein
LTGLNFSYPANVAAYRIDSVHAAFRFWQSPLDNAAHTTTGTLPMYALDHSNDYFTALYFQTSSIHMRKFNLTGIDELLWAANGIDSYVGYHGTNCGRFSINWSTGKGTVWDVAVPGNEEEEEDMPVTNASYQQETTSATTTSDASLSCLWITRLTELATLASLFLLLWR